MVRTKSLVTTEITNIAPKKGIGKKRIEKLNRAIKNRDRRLTSWTKRMYADDSTKTLQERYRALVRGQYLPGKVAVDFSQITSIKDYNALIKMLNADKLPKFKAQRTHDMREWLKTSISQSLMIRPETDLELYNRIDRMTDREIIDFRIQHPHLISKIFYFYSDTSSISIEDRDAMWDAIREALGLEPLKVKVDSMVLM